MSKNYLLIYSEQLATEIELLCQNIKAPSNTLFQIRKSSSSIYANIRESFLLKANQRKYNVIDDLEWDIWYLREARKSNPKEKILIDNYFLYTSNNDKSLADDWETLKDVWFDRS